MHFFFFFGAGAGAGAGSAFTLGAGGGTGAGAGTGAGGPGGGQDAPEKYVLQFDRNGAGSGGAQQPPEPLTPAQQEASDKLMAMRVNVLRVAMRLGAPGHQDLNQVMLRLDIVEQMRSGGSMNVVGRQVDSAARRLAEQRARELEAAGAPLDIEPTVLVVGKAGAGKSTLINELLGYEAAPLGATDKVRVVRGQVEGMRVTFVDTPGLHASSAESARNRRVLRQAKGKVGKKMADLVIYADRLDNPAHNFGDLPILNAITQVFGKGVWYHCMVVFTHGASKPLENAENNQLDFRHFCRHRQSIVQQMMRQSTRDLRIVNPVAVLECHPECRRDAKGNKMLPDGSCTARTDALMKPFISSLLGEAQKQAEILQGGKVGAKAAEARRRQQMMLRRGANQVFPVFLNNLFQDRDPGKPKLADDAEMADYEKRSEDIRQAKNEAKQHGYEDPYPDTSETLEKSTAKVPALGERGQTEGFPFLLTTNTPDMEPASIPGPRPQLGATFDDDPEISLYRYNYIEKDGYCRPLSDPAGLDHMDGITGFTASGTAVPKKPPSKIPWYFQAPKTELEPGTRSHWLYQINSSDSCQMGQANFVFNAEQSFWRTRESVIVGVDAQSLGPENMFVARTEARRRYKLRGYPGDCKFVGGASMFAVAPKGQAPSNKLWKNPVGLKAGARYRLKQNRINLSIASVLGKDNTGWKNVLGATGTYTIKPERNSGDAAPIMVTGTLMHTKGKNALGGDVQFARKVGPAKLNTLATGKLNLNSQGSGSFNLRLTGDSPKMPLAAALPMAVTSVLSLLGIGGQEE